MAVDDLVRMECVRSGLSFTSHNFLSPFLIFSLSLDSRFGMGEWHGYGVVNLVFPASTFRCEI